MRSDGTLAPGWPVDGLRVTDNLEYDSAPRLSPDGQGGAYLGWDRGVCNQCLAVMQHVSGEAARFPGWPADGQAVPGEPRTGEPELVADGAGGAIVAWEDAGGRLRALRVAPDGPVPVLLALVSANAAADRVVLVWYGAEAAGRIARVERRSEGADWERLASLTADGEGRVRYEDRAVRAGTRYGYRLAYTMDGEERFTAETWVEVPAIGFALHGVNAQPVVGPLWVRFSLASAEPARLALHDLAGRLVVGREVGSLGPGAHRVELGGERHLPAGLYTLVLTQGTRRKAVRALILR